MFGSFLQVPGLGVSTLQLQTESWFWWRPDGKENVVEVEADKNIYLDMIKSREWERRDV